MQYGGKVAIAVAR